MIAYIMPNWYVFLQYAVLYYVFYVFICFIVSHLVSYKNEMGDYIKQVSKHTHTQTNNIKQMIR